MAPLDKPTPWTSTAVPGLAALTVLDGGLCDLGGEHAGHLDPLGARLLTLGRLKPDEPVVGGDDGLTQHGAVRQRHVKLGACRTHRDHT